MLDVAQLSDLETAKQVAQLLEFENKRLHARLSELTKTLAELRGENGPEQLALELTRLREQVDRMQHRLFGAKSEKRASGTRRRDGDEAQEQASTQQRGHGPASQPHVPIVERTETLDENERACDSCGGHLQEWKGQYESSDVITVIRRSFVIERQKRQKYRCRCHANIVCAPAPQRLLPGGRYSLEFAVEVAIDKYVHHIPLHRQVARMRSEGLIVTTQTLFDQLYVIQALLSDCYDLLGDRVLNGGLVHIDETPWRLLVHPSQRWYIWCITGHDAVYYWIRPSRSSRMAAEMLGEYDGIVIADGYSVYSSLAKAPGSSFTLAFCWAHVRRKFIEAERSYPQCSTALEYISELYKVERSVPDPWRLDEGAAREDAFRLRAQARDRHSRPLIAKLHDWALAQRGLPQSSLRLATDYMLRLWPGLIRFLDDPRIPLDNNPVERQLRGPIVGRKNHLGSRSVRGIRVTEVLYTLAHSAMLAGIDPRSYLLAAAQRALDEPGAVLLPHEMLTRDS